MVLNKCRIKVRYHVSERLISSSFTVGELGSDGL